MKNTKSMTKKMTSRTTPLCIKKKGSPFYFLNPDIKKVIPTFKSWSEEVVNMPSLFKVIRIKQITKSIKDEQP